MSDLRRLLTTAANLEDEAEWLPPYFNEVDAKNMRDVAAELIAVRARSEYWKAEHLAGNKVIDELRARVAELEAQIDKPTVDVETTIEMLQRKIAAHERVCAGTWVPVGERLPASYKMLNVLRGFPSLLPITEFGTVYNGFEFMSASQSRTLPPVTHWLDAKLPGDSNG